MGWSCGVVLFTFGVVLFTCGVVLFTFGVVLFTFGVVLFTFGVVLMRTMKMRMVFAEDVDRTRMPRRRKVLR